MKAELEVVVTLPEIEQHHHVPRHEIADVDPLIFSMKEAAGPIAIACHSSR